MIAHRGNRALIAALALATSSSFACGGTPESKPAIAAAPAAPPPAPPTAAPVNADSAPATWLARSNEHTKLLLNVMAKFAPEHAARLGVDWLDDKIIDLEPGHAARERAAHKTALDELVRRQTAETDPLVKQDLAILVHAADLRIRRSDLEEAQLVPYINVTELVFGSTTALLDDQIAPQRREAIVARFRKYAGLDGQKPLTTLVQAEIVEAMKHPNLAMPSKIELEKHLATNAMMRDGIVKLLEKYSIADSTGAHQRLIEQLAAYDDFVKKTMLPKARPTFALPPPIYAIELEGYGVDLPPAELTAVAHTGFNEIQAEMKRVAAALAKEKNLPSSDYRDVIRTLKKDQLTGDTTILDLYKKRLAEIEDIIRREKLVTLPSRAARIRLGTPAENAQQPAPHMMPPRLLGNNGEQGEFVLPLTLASAPGTAASAKSQKLDDFTFDAATWTLTAHEARPGHELQFAAMVERGVSTARMIYAFNSTNVEGWGLYSEAIVYPYMPLDGQLISLQLRLQRAARAFIDPELQQGKWTFESAKAFLMKEVCLSNAFATSEVERYTFRSPGQATSYYFGLLKLRELRKEVETRLGPSFNAQKFHDFILGQGLLPPKLLREAALKEFPDERSRRPFEMVRQPVGKSSFSRDLAARSCGFPLRRSASTSGLESVRLPRLDERAMAALVEPDEPDVRSGRLAPGLIFALLSALASCAPWASPGGESLDACAGAGATGAAAGPVTIYSVVPPLGAVWWYVGQEPADYGTEGETPAEEADDEPPFSGAPPPPPTTEPLPNPAATETEDPNGEDGKDGDKDGKDDDGTADPQQPNPNGSGPDGSSTQSMRPLDLALPNGCYTCDVTCTAKGPGPGQPRGFSSASGASAISQSAACKDAEDHLKGYASRSYSLELEACGVVPTGPSSAPLGAQ